MQQRSWETYSPVMPLGRRSDVTLLRNDGSGELVVHRLVNAEQAAIYRILQQTASPHIPCIYDIIENGTGQYAIFEEYVDGQTLADILREQTTVAEPLAAWYVTQLCEALSAIHKAGLIHRDIKPGNVMVTPDDKLYLIDFDIARSHKVNQASDTELLGTQGYAAPEQFGFRQTDVRTDIYAVGVLLNQLLTGEMPQKRLPKGSIAKIILRCTDIDPRRRYRSANALKRTLRAYLPQGHAWIMHLLRRVPGFRTWTAWKMILAGSLYTLFFLCCIIMVYQMASATAYAQTTLFISFSYYLLLFLFAFDCFRLRSRVEWLQKARGSIWYWPRCILFATMASLIFLTVCAIILLMIFPSA